MRQSDGMGGIGAGGGDGAFGLGRHYGSNVCVPLKVHYVEALIPSVAALGDRASQDVIKAS